MMTCSVHFTVLLSKVLLIKANGRFIQPRYYITYPILLNLFSSVDKIFGGEVQNISKVLNSLRGVT